MVLVCFVLFCWRSNAERLAGRVTGKGERREEERGEEEE